MNIRKSLGKSATKVFKPSVTTITKSATFVFDNSPKNKPIPSHTKQVTMAPNEGKSKLKSPKIFKASTLGFSFKVTNGEDKPKTPGASRKSLATTPFRYVSELKLACHQNL